MIASFRMIRSYDLQFNLIEEDRQSIKNIVFKILDLHKQSAGEENPSINSKIKNRIEEYNEILNTINVNIGYRTLGLSRSKNFILYLAKQIINDYNKRFRTIRKYRQFIDKFIEFSINLNKFEVRTRRVKHRIEALKDKSFKCLRHVKEIEYGYDGIPVIVTLVDESDLSESLERTDEKIDDNHDFDNGTYAFPRKNSEAIDIFENDDTLNQFVLRNNLRDNINQIRDWLSLVEKKNAFKKPALPGSEIVRGLLLHSKEVLASPLQIFMLVSC
ncbi:hypothetical protein MXB_5101 [Myxobolus squamalis]|nr:hypothetical protein MXB_5101 [Myxobolus squamalis]